MATTLSDLLSNAYNRSVDFAKQKATSLRDAYAGVRSGMAGEPALEPTGAQRVGQTIRGATLRGAEAVGNAAGTAQAAGQRIGESIGGTARKVLDAAHSAMNPEAASAGAVDPAAVQAHVAGQEFRTRANPNAPGSPEAQAFRASGAGNPGAPKAPKAGLLRTAGTRLGTVAKGLGVAGTALAAADAGIKATEGQTPEQLTGTGGAVQGGATELYDNLTLGQGRKFAHGVSRALGAVPTLRTPQDSGFPVRPGLLGVGDRFAQGWREGDALEKRAAGTQAVAGSTAAPNPTNAGSDGVTPQPAVQRTPDGALPQTNNPEAAQAQNKFLPSGHQDETTAEMLRTTVPAEGTGSFQRTTPGNVGPVTAVGGAASDSLVGATAQSESLRRSAPSVAQPLGSERPDSGYNQPSAISTGAPRDVKGLPAPAGAPAGSQSQFASSTTGGQTNQTLRAASAVPPLSSGLGMDDLVRNRQALRHAQLGVEERGQDLTYQSAVMQRQIQLAQLNRELGNENEKRVNEQIEQHAKGKQLKDDNGKPLEMPTGIFSNANDKAAYEAAQAKEVAATKNRFQRSIADRKDGATIQTVRPAEVQQLRELDKIRDKVVDSRTGAFQTLRDLIGQKRFDSENLYSYSVARDDQGKVLPAAPSAQGGYVVTLGNGNQIHVKELVGGNFVLFGANKPIDADTMAMIRPAIVAAEKGKK